tara:strand:+ start:544 stop:882 length:339 start_codon:yes stop_codon:yes gene_type:complete
MQYKVYECEEQVTKTGKKLKKLVLKVEGQENTEPRVTLWEDHPEYAQAAAGGTINGVLEKKDSGVPIPAHPGKNYVNRTLLPEGTQTLQSSGDLEARVKKLEDKVFSKDIPF